MLIKVTEILLFLKSTNSNNKIALLKYIFSAINILDIDSTIKYTTYFQTDFKSLFKFAINSIIDTTKLFLSIL